MSYQDISFRPIIQTVWESFSTPDRHPRQTDLCSCTFRECAFTHYCISDNSRCSMFILCRFLKNTLPWHFLIQIPCSHNKTQFPYLSQMINLQMFQENSFLKSSLSKVKYFCYLSKPLFSSWSHQHPGHTSSDEL